MNECTEKQLGEGEMRTTGRAPAKTPAFTFPGAQIYMPAVVVSVNGPCVAHISEQQARTAIQFNGATTLAASLTHNQISLSVSLSFARTGI